MIDRICLDVATYIIKCRFAQSYLFFFFQAEDGIRDLIVTGVQTCALPISAAGQQTLQRRSCGSPASTSTSWLILTTSTAIATPGRGPLITGQNRICVSEVAEDRKSVV